MILPEISPENTLKRAEQLLAEVNRLNVQYQGQTFESIRLSVGVALFPQHGAGWETVLRAADTALYQAKAGGRNRVVMVPFSV